MPSTSTPRASIDRLSQRRPLRDQLADDARTGLTATPKLLPPTYLYDARGSQLFEQITRLPEYYPTHTETAILEAHAAEAVAAVAPEELVELGSGSSRKTRLLLEAMHAAGTGRRYVPLDISSSAVTAAADALTADYPWLEVRGAVGDFATDLPRLARHGRRLLAFLGSTIGNLDAVERARLLSTVATTLEPGDGFLLGADLVKPAEVLVPAYDDAAGVTAAFNRNLLTVLNRELDGNLPVEAFAHRAVYNDVAARIEMHLVAQRPVDATLAAIDLRVRFEAGEPLITEYSHKFRVAPLTAELQRAGLHVIDVWQDVQARFAILHAAVD